ncbi:MAG: pentapeptide repeat-containing protein [Candidatus Brocadiales bacterium]
MEGANLENVNLRRTAVDNANLKGVKGLTKEQKADLKERGAIVD